MFLLQACYTCVKIGSIFKSIEMRAHLSNLTFLQIVIRKFIIYIVMNISKELIIFFIKNN